jgi:hypothetical protein
MYDRLSTRTIDLFIEIFIRIMLSRKKNKQVRRSRKLFSVDFFVLSHRRGACSLRSQIAALKPGRCR